MAENTDNLTLKLLQEMRKEMNTRFDAIDKRFDAMDERFDGVDLRIDGITHIITILAGHHYRLEERVDKLEAK